MNKKLNLQWISDVIKDDYKKWTIGDTVTIESQTNTGKTTFIIDKLIKEMKEHDKMLYICNRRELKRQIKLELLKRFNLPIPETTEELDIIHKIKNIHIVSYQSIEEGILKHIYQSKTYIMSSYKYIVCDECHFFFTDASFNNKTHLSFKDLILTHYENSIKILISATMDEIVNAIDKNTKGNLYKYDTGRDYSYLNVKYFKYYKDISQLIINDDSNDKWIVFVANKKKGNTLKATLIKNDIKTIFISSESKHAERENISKHYKFNSKVLITTKCLDNGISIHDEDVKNIVITAYDKTTFLQEIGRLRIDIENARPINLYIDTLYKKNFTYKFNALKEKKEDTELYDNKYNEFKMKYDHNVSSVPEDLFYLDENKEKKWQRNMMGYCRLIKDYNFCFDMIEDFKFKGEYAYILKQLEWIGLNGTFGKENLIENVLSKTEVESMEEYLNSIAGKKLFSNEQEKLSNLLINELVTLHGKVDYRTKILKPSTLESIIRDQLELPFAVSKPKAETKGEMRNKKYIIITKIN